MKTKDWKLEDKRRELNSIAFQTIKDCLNRVKEQDKEFLRRLKVKINNKRIEIHLKYDDRISQTEIETIIDDLAGKSLVEEEE